MITDSVHAAQVQTRRRESGKKGRAKAVRRWAKRECGTTIDAYSYFMPDGMRENLRGDFTGCRPFQEVHDLTPASFRGTDFLISNARAVTVCRACIQPYGAHRSACPYCGADE